MSATNQKTISHHTGLIGEETLKVVDPNPKTKRHLNSIPQIAPGDSEYKTELTFYKGINGTKKNFIIAREWFLKSATKGNAAAQYNLGVMSYMGQGMEKSFSDAAKWFEQAANQDNTLAQYNLGFLFFEGKGVAKDYL